jgi:hypothetical protein
MLTLEFNPGAPRFIFRKVKIYAVIALNRRIAGTHRRHTQRDPDPRSSILQTLKPWFTENEFISQNSSVCS